MLIFIDQPKQIRIVRTTIEEGATTRAPIGKVMKSNLELTDDLRAALDAEEAESVEAVIATYKQAEAVKRQYFALQFPPIVRETMDFFEDGASDSERQLIMSSLMEALRRMRNFERSARKA